MAWRWRSYPLINEAAEPEVYAPRTGGQTSPAAITASEAAAGSPGFTKYAYDNGDKFSGGFGATKLLITDYWTLRARSAQLYETNHYARGLIRRLVTNVINTGLSPEAAPEEKILGVPEQSMLDWSEEVETRFALWANEPWTCDQAEQFNFGKLQAIAEIEALVAGDVLVTLLQFSPTGLPRLGLINGARVRTPYNEKPRIDGGRICEGVELDAQGRHVAYWVQQDDGSSKRLPAWGEKSGRRLAWLYYGMDKRNDSVRGKPLLSLVLQALAEIDRYRDAALRKAVINSMLAGFIKKAQPVQGSMPLTGGGGAVRVGSEMLGPGPNSEPREFSFTEMLPGVYLQELKVGEEPTAMNANGTDEKFGVFEQAVLASMAFGNEVPPEIYTLSFSSNYSASQAAINEFKMFLNRKRTDVGAGLCQPVYVEWLLASALAGKVKAPGLIDAWRNPKAHDVYAAWVSADWAGAIKPAVDLTKLVNGYEKLIAIGAITRARATRELTGMKFSKVVKIRAREDAELAKVLEPMNKVNGIAPAEPPEDKPLDDEGNHPDDVETDDGEKD